MTDYQKYQKEFGAFIDGMRDTIRNHGRELAEGRELYAYTKPHLQFCLAPDRPDDSWSLLWNQKIHGFYSADDWMKILRPAIGRASILDH
jgi:hypothetical protein